MGPAFPNTIKIHQPFSNASTPKYDRQTKYGKNLHRDYHLDGYHGRKGTTKIDEPYHPRYRLYTEFH